MFLHILLFLLRRWFLFCVVTLFSWVDADSIEDLAFSLFFVETARARATERRARKSERERTLEMRLEGISRRTQNKMKTETKTSTLFHYWYRSDCLYYMMFEESNPHSHYMIPPHTLRLWELTYSSHIQSCFCHVRYHQHHHRCHPVTRCIMWILHNFPSSFAAILYFYLVSLPFFCFLQRCVVFSIYFIRYHYLNMFADSITSRAFDRYFCWSFFCMHKLYMYYLYVLRIWFVKPTEYFWI